MGTKRVRKMHVTPRRKFPQHSVDPITPAGGAPADPPAGGAPAPVAGEKTLTQTEVNTIVTREKAAAAASGEKKAADDLAAALGVTVDEAKAIIKSHQDKAEGEKSDAQKAREAADKEKAEAETEKLAARTETHHTRIERALVAAGITLPEDEAKSESTLARVRGLLTVAVGATAEEIKADVAVVKADFPGLFAEAKDPKKTPPGSDPKTPPKKGDGGKTGIQLGMERAAAAVAARKRPDPAGSTKT